MQSPNVHMLTTMDGIMAYVNPAIDAYVCIHLIVILFTTDLNLILKFVFLTYKLFFIYLKLFL